jgi:hypothetical protein
MLNPCLPAILAGAGAKLSQILQKSRYPRFSHFAMGFSPLMSLQKSSTFYKNFAKSRIYARQGGFL